MQKHNVRSNTTGRFVPQKQVNVVPGRLYSYKGVVVRAKKLCSNGLRFVSSHKKLNGFVRDEELRPIDPTTVRSYLENA
jgi:hypothetical protein